MSLPLKLSIELIPQTSWYNNLRSLMPKEAWNELRKKVVKENNYQCFICQGKGFLECHEVWTYDDSTHVQKLVAIVPLCELCHAVKHMGHTGTKTKTFYDGVVSHFMKVNTCDRIAFEKARLEAFAVWEERSKHEWRIDIGEYEGVNFI